MGLCLFTYAWLHYHCLVNIYFWIDATGGQSPDPGSAGVRGGYRHHGYQERCFRHTSVASIGIDPLSWLRRWFRECWALWGTAPISARCALSQNLLHSLFVFCSKGTEKSTPTICDVSAFSKKHFTIRRTNIGI